VNSNVDEGRFERALDVVNDTLVDVTFEAAALGRLDVELHQLAIFDNRDAQLVVRRRVD
jgi:hypothetical protein